MDKDNLMRGRVYLDAQTSYDRTMHIAGVPRRYWHVKRDEFTFYPFTEKRTWISLGEEKSGIHNFPASEQQAFFDGMVHIINDEVENRSWFEYAQLGAPIMISSSPTDHNAKLMAGYVAGTIQKNHIEAKTRWFDTNQRTKYGRPVAPDPTVFPDLVVLTGLHPDPTPESWESVHCWMEWAIRRCPCIMVGSGCDPMTLSRHWYGIEPLAVLFAYNEFKNSVTYG